MKCYVSGVNEIDGSVEHIGTGSNSEYYESVGMQLRDVEHGPDGRWYLSEYVPPYVPTMEDYDKAVEDHLKKERENRGYTSREPSDYYGSSVERWAQDAVDWIEHRDAVMIYALDTINHYKETGEAPSLEVFKSNLPLIKWTFE